MANIIPTPEWYSCLWKHVCMLTLHHLASTCSFTELLAGWQWDSKNLSKVGFWGLTELHVQNSLKSLLKKTAIWLFFKDLSLSHIKGHRKEAKGSSGCFVGKYNQKPPGHLCESYWGARFTFLIQTFSYLSKSLNATACCICSVRCKCTATCAAIRVLYNTCPLMHTYPHALCRHTLLVGESCVHS